MNIKKNSADTCWTSHYNAWKKTALQNSVQSSLYPAKMLTTYLQEKSIVIKPANFWQFSQNLQLHYQEQNY